jgi:hypothetical protein
MSFVRWLKNKVAPPTELPPRDVEAEQKARQEAVEALRSAAMEARRLRFRSLESIPQIEVVPE